MREKPTARIVWELLRETLAGMRQQKTSSNQRHAYRSRNTGWSRREARVGNVLNDLNHMAISLFERIDRFGDIGRRGGIERARDGKQRICLFQFAKDLHHGRDFTLGPAAPDGGRQHDVVRSRGRGKPRQKPVIDGQRHREQQVITHTLRRVQQNRALSDFELQNSNDRWFFATLSDLL